MLLTTMGNQCTANEYSPGGGTRSKNRFDSMNDASPAASKKRQLPWSFPRHSSLSFVSSSASFTPNTADNTSFDILKKSSSMSALDLQQQGKSTNNDDDYGTENVFYYVSPTSFSPSDDSDEPFYLGMRRDSFGVGDVYHQTSRRFRTKRFRSKLELGLT
jgi:hypothetical protein